MMKKKPTLANPHQRAKCEAYMSKVVETESNVHELQEEICKHYPRLHTDRSVLLPVYFRVASFDNIIWLRVPAIIKSYEIELEEKINKLVADWICRDCRNYTKFDMILKNKEKTSWIANFNKEWMNETSKLKDYSTKEFYLLEYSYIYSNSSYINKDVKQKGLVGIILMYCAHNNVHKMMFTE